MSQENVEDAYREVVTAWNQGDLDGLVERTADDVVVHTALGGVEGEFRGHAGVRRWWEEFHDVFPDWRVEVLSLRALGSATLAQLRQTGHGGESAAPVDQTLWHVVHWRDGKASRISRHDTEAEALEAVGLSE